MSYPQLLSWANDYGFTVDELAWIQPSYPPPTYSAQPGVSYKQMPDDEVLELFVDSKDEKLYVGGSFVMVDSATQANHIAYITELQGNYSWHTMGKGVDGPVHAITEYKNAIFVGGFFSKAGDSVVKNIAYWDGQKWYSAGCLDGVVKDLLVHQGDLYACGDFKDCDNGTESNLAVWNGSNWTHIKGITGHINTLHSTPNNLIAGGLISYNNNQVNILKYSKSNGISTYNLALDREIMDIEVYDSFLLVGCKGISVNDTNIIYKLNSNNWQKTPLTYNSISGNLSCNTICVHYDTTFKSEYIWMGGDFFALNGTTYNSNNCYDAYRVITGKTKKYSLLLRTNNTVNKMTVFKGVLFGAGNFTHTTQYGVEYLFRTDRSWTPLPPPTDTVEDEYTKPANTILNSAMQPTTVTDLSDNNQFLIYPNPSHNKLNVENQKGATYSITSLSGKIILKGYIESDVAQINIAQIPNGLYIINIHQKEKVYRTTFTKQ